MAYQRLSKYQISFPLFKVGEPWKFQMSSFCVNTGETHSSKQAIFPYSKQNDKMSHIWHKHTKGFQNIQLVSLYSKSVSHENSKCLHFASVLMKHIVQNRPVFLIPNKMTKWVIFDTMAYQRLPKYHISFPLFKVQGIIGAICWPNYAS